MIPSKYKKSSIVYINFAIRFDFWTGIKSKFLSTGIKSFYPSFLTRFKLFLILSKREILGYFYEIRVSLLFKKLILEFDSNIWRKLLENYMGVKVLRFLYVQTKIISHFTKSRS